MQKCNLLLLLLFLQPEAYSQAGGCPGGLTPAPDTAADRCLASIQSYLARAVNLDGLAELNYPAACWGLGSYPPPDATPGLNCRPPYVQCSSNFCPDKYRQTIDMLVDLQASFLLRCAMALYHEANFQPGRPYWTAAGQLVRDVHGAYDCAGLPRPVIQAALFATVSAQVEEVPIPEDYLDPDFLEGYFFDDFGAAQDYYLKDTDGDGRPGPRRFSRERMLQAGNADGESCDINAVETRMWLYYVGTAFIDFGYTSLHLGLVDSWGDRPVGFVVTHGLLEKLRSYALSKGSFVLLNAEGAGNGTAYKLGDTDQLLFDFMTVPLRPREIALDPAGRPVPSDPVDGGCATPYDAGMFERTPCENMPYPAFIDPCQFEKFGVNAAINSGVSPAGCPYYPGPFLVYFDFGPGFHCPDTRFGPDEPAYYAQDVVYCCSDPDGCFDPDGRPCPWDVLCCDPTAGQPNYVSTWGFDDNRWFYEIQRQSPQCAAYWLEEFYRQTRELLHGQGFLQLPGILVLKFPENLIGEECDGRPGEDAPTGTGRYLLADAPEVFRPVAAALDPQVSTLSVRSYPCEVTTDELCGYDAGRDGSQYAAYTRHAFEVENPDLSSVYSWQVRSPDGAWSAPQHGRRFEFTAWQPGRYLLRWRQENLLIRPGGFYETVRTFDNFPCCEPPAERP